VLLAWINVAVGKIRLVLQRSQIGTIGLAELLWVTLVPMILGVIPVNC